MDKFNKKEIDMIIAHINSNVLKSDIGNYIFNVYPYIDGTAVYSISDSSNATMFSLRSTKYHMDMGEMSKSYLGGGGHRNASGASINAITNCVSSHVYDNKIYDVLRNGLYYSTLDQVGEIAYLNVTSNSWEIGKYLLQIKFTLNDRNICQICSIRALNETLKEVKEVDWNEKSEFVMKYREKLLQMRDILVVGLWKYSNGKTYYSIFYDPSIKEQIREYVQKSMKITKEDEGYLKCEKSELCYQL